jgi:hypothetical protein
MLILSAISGATSAGVLSYMMYDVTIQNMKREHNNNIIELKKKYEK